MNISVRRSLVCVVIMLAGLSQALAMDTDGYASLAKEVVRGVMSKPVADIDGLIAKQEKLLQIGVTGCLDYAKEHPADSKFLQLVVDNAAAMQALTLEQIEDQWHDANFPISHGIDIDSYDHFGPVISLMDTVVHPATGIIALKEYKKTQNPELLTQVKEELSEVLEHIQHVN